MGKIAMITGGTTGIGLSTAKVLGEKGYSIILNGIDKEQGKFAEKELKELGVTVNIYYFNVMSEESILDGFEEIKKNYDHIDVLVNCAGGLGGRSRFEEMETSFYRNVLALNLDSVFFVTRSAIPMLKKGTDASIINFASNAAWSSGGPGAGIYGTSKAAVVTLTRAMAKDLAEDGIRVNGVSPGTIDTAFHQVTKETNPDMFNSWKKNILMKRFGQPEEVASVIKFLVGTDASFLTGEIIQVNGGQDFL